VLAPETVLEWIDPRPEIEVRGLGLRDTGAVYGELQEVGEMPPGDGPTGERRPKELAVVMLAGCIDMDIVEIYELFLDVGTEGIVAPRGRLVKRP
jgi:hypothetical protein